MMVVVGWLKLRGEKIERWGEGADDIRAHWQVVARQINSGREGTTLNHGLGAGRSVQNNVPDFKL
jgi:hypothetical protein